MSKRFGFWPHITHVIVLTFKEIKHLSDYRTVGLKVGPRYCFVCFFPTIQPGIVLKVFIH